MVTLALVIPADAAVGEIADQPGVTSPAQPGTTAPPPPPAAPEPQPEPEHTSPAVRNDAPSRPVPPSEPASPIVWEDLHLPEPTPTVAPIEPPPKTIRIGDWSTPSPDWLPPEVTDGINTAAAGFEAAAAQFWDSIGLPPERSDRVAAAGTAGTGIGAVAAGVPAAAVAAVPGAALGAAAGAAIGAAVGVVGSIGVEGALAVAGAVATAEIGAIPGILAAAAATPIVFGGTIGTATAVGAAIGAAIGGAITGALGGIPAAIAGGTVGASVGAAVGVGE
ncbi:hypothetical protein ACQPXH_00250 [Nocardia sp. CA-135953]|uniref:hypothetical protein n=1 Tax=Nocardia sp. CA-135953 TaxID=3239978 RepID=UPI003D984532